ncbi:MAG: hypothetical protein AAFQ94_03515 [Bacteroidota bacterium]
MMKNPARVFRKVVLTSAFIWLVTFFATAQRSVGIGTSTPNPNAVLELVTTGDQGLLLPRMTTAQRTATSLTSILTNTDNGLTVFDTDDGNMYFWYNGSWITSSVTLTPGAGIDIVGNTITNIGDIDPTDDLTTSSIAAGDVTGDFANTLVVGIGGNAVSTTAPTTGQVLKWDGTEWVPSADDGQVYTQGAGIDLTGNVITNLGDVDATDDLTVSSVAAGDVTGDFANTVVGGIRGNAVSTTAPTTGQVLKWNGTEWEPSADDGQVYTQGTGIDLTGNVITNLGDVDATDDLTIGSVAAGDVTGNFANTVVGGIRGNAVSTTAPTTGQVLKWNGSEWEPSADDGQVYTQGTGIDLTGNVITNLGDVDATDDVLQSASPAVGDISGSYTAGLTINNDAVNTAKILNSAVTDAKISDLALTKLQQGTALDGDLLSWNNGSGNWEPIAFDASFESQTIEDVLLVSDDAGALSITNLTDVSLTGGTVTMATEAIHQQNLQDLTGVGVGNTNLGNLSHPVLQDNLTIRDALVQLGDSVDVFATDKVNQEALQTLTGVGEGSIDLGMLSHPVLLDNQTILQTLVQLGDSVDAFSLASFNAVGEIPVGDGSGLVSSNLFSAGGNIGIGNSAPVTQLQMDDRYHIFSFTGQNGANFGIISNNFHATSPTVFQRTVTGTGSFIVLSDSSGFEFHKLYGGPAGTVVNGDFESIMDVDSAEIRVRGLIDFSPGSLNIESENDQVIRLPQNNVGNGYELRLEAGTGDTQGGDLVLRPGGVVSTGTDGRVVSEGSLFLQTTGSQTGNVTFQGLGGAADVTIQGSTTVGSSYTLTLPSDAGAVGEFLRYGSGGQLTWAAPATFSTSNSVPRGDGSGLSNSNIVSNGFNVGIGTAIGTERLEVGGNIEIPAANEFQYASAKTKQLSYHPIEFMANRSDGQTFEIVRTNAVTRHIFYQNGSGLGQAYSSAPVKLPDGAVITQLEAWVVDNDVAQTNSFVRVDFYRSEVGVSNSFQQIATVQTTQADSSPAVVPLSTTAIGNGTVDNGNFAYYLEFVANDNSNQLQLHGVRITYTVTKAD